MDEEERVERSLWVNDAQHRYFLIPVARDLPVGPMVLRTLTGQEQFVESASVAPYEISEEAAQQHLEDQIDQTMERTRTALSQALVADPGSVELQVDPQVEREALKLLSSLVGTSPADLTQDPEQLRQYLQSFLSEIRSGLAAGLEDPDALEPIQDQLAVIQDHLQQQGIQLDLDLRRTVEQIRANGGSEAEMEETLEQLRPLIMLLKQSILESPELQSALIDLVPTSTIPPADPRIQEEYRQSARRAVSEAMQNVKVPKFDFNELSKPRSEDQD